MRRLRLNNRLGALLGVISSADGRPTQQSYDVFKLLAAELDKDLADLDRVLTTELPKINARTPYLAMTANFAVMAGLLGTISGMIKSFGSVGSDEGGNKATERANGIAEALNCTAFGIGTSLVGLLGYSLLQGKTTHVTDDINEVTVQVVNLVTTHRAQMQPQ